MLKNINELSNYNEVKRILAKYGYNEVTLDNIYSVECNMDLEDDVDLDEMDIINNAINELTDRDKKSKKFDEKCDEGMKEFNEKFESYKDVAYGGFDNTKELELAVKDITKMKRLGAKRVTGYLAKNKDKLNANEKKLLRTYINLITNSKKVYDNCAEYLSDSKELDKIIDEMEKDIDETIAKINRNEKCRRRIYTAGIATLTVATALLAASVTEVAIASTGIGLALFGLVRSVRIFGRKIG